MQWSTAPVIGTPKCASTIGGVFGSITATVSPSPRSIAASREASRTERSRTSRQVRRSGPWITAQRSGYTSATQSSSDSGVSGTWFAGLRSRPWR